MFNLARKFNEVHMRLTTGIFIVSLMTFGCQQSQDSETKDIATASSVKTGMFTPEKSSEVSYGYATKVKTEVSASKLAVKLGYDIKEGNGQDVYVVPTYEGAQILLIKQGEAKPIPIGGVTREGQTFFLSAPLSTIKNGAGLVGSTFFQLSKIDEPLKGVVSSDGNQTNMWVTIEIINNLGVEEDYMVSYLNQLDSLGSKPIRLIKIGNNIIENKTGESVLEFRELGNQVWRVYGIYNDAYFTHGSVVWSPDMVRYFSIKNSAGSIVEWKKQDDNSMDIVSKDVKVEVPKIVKELLAEKITTNVKSLPLTGPVPHTTSSRAISLKKRTTATPSIGLSLTSGPSVAPEDQTSEEYHEFFDSEPRSAGLSLDGAQPFSGSNRYPVGAQVDLGHGIVGKVVSATSNTTTPGGWFTSKQSVNTTYVQTPSGAIREIKSTNGSAVEQRSLNQYDIKNMQTATQATLNSPAHAQSEAKFRESIAASNKAAQATIDSADSFTNKYGTAQGIATNVVLPVATAGIASKAGDAAGLATYAQKGTSATTAVMTKQLAEAGVGFVGNTAQFIANGATDKGAIAGSGADISLQAMGAGLAPANGYVGAATTAISAAVGEGVNAQGGNFDASNSAIGVSTAVLGGVANSVVPGAGVAVQVAGDGAQVGANVLQMQAADNRVSQSSNDFYQPVKENQQFNEIFANAQFDSPAPAPVSTAPAPVAAPVSTAPAP
jgi:hypothetical protein